MKRGVQPFKDSSGNTVMLTKGSRHPDILQALREEVVVARILQEQQSAQQLAQQSGQQTSTALSTAKVTAAAPDY